ncbi:MAG: gliding motility-associated C-terminal domain-containing protein [Flavobacteriales bacterium]|nr:gliding motility-associated C-terminal domain-containing protein [Flavobacteriales bacterium]
MMRVIVALIFLFLAFSVLSQNVNYSVTITELYADADGNDGGLGINDQDPVWWVFLKDNGTTGTSLTTFQATGCISTTNTFGTWWSGNPSHSGPTIPFAWLNVSNTDATQIITEMEGWEDDCSPYCNYNPSPSLFSSCVANGDDNHDGRGSSGNINFQNDAPCQNNDYVIVIGDYRAKLRIYWEYVSVDAGTINGDQFVCSGGNPTLLGNVSSGAAASSTWFTFQWQQDVGCTGAFVDIPGATNATYDPPLGIIQNTCFRRKLVYGCGFFLSNEVQVQIDTPPSDPSSITASPTSLCGLAPVTLTVNGGSLGSNSAWTWYAGDPNSGGTLLGTGSPFVANLSSTTNIFVRAEGNCGMTNTANQIIIVETPSIAPTTVTASLNTICVGNSINLTVSGGAPGNGAIYAWYDVDPTIGLPTPVFTSTGVNYTNVSPLITTTYYCRLEGCDTTLAASTTITVNTLSSDPSGISSSVSQVCSGSPVTLTVNGGNLGTGADWYWYAGGCGAGAAIGNGTSITINPTSTTTYYVRAQGTCNMSGCASITILVDNLSADPVTVISSDASVCPGDVTTLSVIGGSLGTGANWQWYNGACGGLNVGSGSTIAVSPTATTVYYVRAEGACNTTSCSNLSINVETLSVAATGATSSINNICPNASVDLNVQGGTLGDGATWEWYQGSCGGIYVGSGTTLTVNPSSTTTYYVRAEGNCNSTTCVSVTVTVVNLSTAPSSAIASSNSVCPGGSVTLTVNGGTLVTGDVWTWYEGGCGAGTSVGTGNNITLNPSVASTYYVRAEGTCGVTSCASASVSMNTVSTDPTGITASSTAICVGQSTVLNVSGGTLGTGANWQWYQGSCGGGPVGSGNSISVSPTATTTYFVRAEGTCGNSNCTSVTISVGAGVADPTTAFSSSNNICPGDEIDLTVIGQALPSAYSYVWYTGACGAVPVGVGDVLTLSPTATETYYVRAVGTCGSTACADVTVTVLDGSISADGIAVSNNNFCLGESTTLTVDGGYLTSGAQWMWYENSCGGTAIGSGTAVSVQPANSSSYYVRAEGGTCGNTSCVDVFISVIETIVHINPYDTLCGIGPSFRLLGGEPAGGNYSGNGVSNNVFDPSTAGVGVHPITYTYTADNGCQNSVMTNIVVESTDLTATVNVDQLPCSQGGTTLSINAKGGNGFLSYSWSNGTYEPTVQFASEGTYYCYIKDGEGCVAKSDEVEVTDEMECIEIPNTFTPNEDGINDTWNLDFTAYSDVNLIVFSKWGREVYATGDKEIHWDGLSPSGAKLPSGVYYYVLELNGGEIKQSGFITLLR